MAEKRHPGFWRRDRVRRQVMTERDYAEIKARAVALAELVWEAEQAAKRCACGNDGCDGVSYRPPYGRQSRPCPILASAQSSSKTASTPAATPSGETGSEVTCG